MTDRALLDDLIAKLREMEEQLSMARLETTSQSLLASRVRQMTILATYVRAKLEEMAESAGALPKTDDDPSRPDSTERR